MGSALHDAGGGDEGDFGVLLQLRDREAAAVAHGGADFGKRQAHIVLEAAGVGHIGEMCIRDSCWAGLPMER